MIKIDAVGRWVSHTSLILERLDSQINMITFKKKVKVLKTLDSQINRITFKQKVKVLTDWILKLKIKVYYTFQQLRLQRI